METCICCGKVITAEMQPIRIMDETYCNAECVSLLAFSKEMEERCSS